MSLKSICLVKLLVIVGLSECIAGNIGLDSITYGRLDADKRYMQNEFVKAGETSVVIGVLSKCVVLARNILDIHYKILATNNTSLQEIRANFVKYVGKEFKFQIYSRDDFNEARCKETDIRNDDCIVDSSNCDRKWKTTEGGSGLYTTAAECVELLARLGYNKTDYGELQRVKANEPEVICPLADMEIIVLVPNRFNRITVDRNLTTHQLKSVFPFLKQEFNTRNGSSEIMQLVDGPHRIREKNTVLEYFATIWEKYVNTTSSVRIERLDDGKNKPFISLWRELEIKENFTTE